MKFKDSWITEITLESMSIKQNNESQNMKMNRMENNPNE